MRGRRRIGQPLIGLWFKLVEGEDWQIRFLIQPREASTSLAIGEVIESTLTRKAASEIYG